MICLLKSPSYELITCVLQMGPYQPIADDLPSRQFPTDKNEHRFRLGQYWFILPDSKSVKNKSGCLTFLQMIAHIALAVCYFLLQ